VLKWLFRKFCFKPKTRLKADGIVYNLCKWYNKVVFFLLIL